MALERRHGHKVRLTACPFCGVDFSEIPEDPPDHFLTCEEADREVNHEQ